MKQSRHKVKHVTALTREPDRVKNYHHSVLETGVMFAILLKFLKTPKRENILALFKMMMVVLRGCNIQAKYPYEILRMLMQQYALLPLREACNILYGCFVNLLGRRDTHIPADQYNEWVVKTQKKIIKKTYANKSYGNIYSEVCIHYQMQ